MADTGTNPSSLHHHSGQSMADSTTPPPQSSHLGIAALPGEGSGGDLVHTATLPPPPNSSGDHDGPVGVNVEHRTRPEHVPEEAPVRQDPLADTTRPAGTGGSRPTRGVGWIRDEREVLCAVYVEATLNSEVGTDQRMETFKSDYCGRFRARLPDSLPQVDRRRARSTPAIDKELKYNIFPMVDGFKNMYMSVLNAKLTGNPTPTDLINATVAKWNGLSPYEGFKAEVVATLKCPPLPYWRILRQLDRFSGAATVAAMRARQRAQGLDGAPSAELCDEDPLDGLSDEEEDLSNVPSSSTYARSRQQRKKSVFQERPLGNKAAKASSRMEAALHRESVSNTVALNALARSAADRADIAFWSSPAAANSAEGREWWAREMQRQLRDADDRPPAAEHANAPEAGEEALLQRQLDAATAAAEAVHPRGNRRGHGRGRGGVLGGDRGAGRCGQRAAVPARGGRGGRVRGGGRGGGVQLTRRGGHSGRSSSNDEEEETVSESDNDSVAEVIPHRRERKHAGEQDKSPPPSPTRPEPSATIEAARAAAELMSSQARTTGDGGADGGVTHGAARADDEHTPTEGADGQDARAVNLNPNVSRSRRPLPPRCRLDLRRGRAAQATKRRRFEEMASAAGFDVDMRILDTMDWEDWSEGVGSSSDDSDEEEP